MSNNLTKKFYKLKTFEEMWDKDLKPFISVKNGLDEGYADGKYTKIFAKYCQHIEGIDLSEDYYNKAKQNLKKYKNVNLRIMDAQKTDYPDKCFDVILNTSFHEFDLSGMVFKMNFKLKTKMLKEMARLSDTIVFAEIDPSNISGELYMLFNPVEDHCLRVKKSNQLIDRVLPQLGYKKILQDKAVDFIQYNTKEEFINDMVDWWSDVYVPKTQKELKTLKRKIEEVLLKHGFLQDLMFYDIFRYTVYKKENY